MDKTHEVNIDTLVGPTHQYAGLSYGNIASQTFKHTKSNPKLAALQGLEKMKTVSDLGIKQLVFPPHVRPDFTFLSKLGFQGKDHEIVEKLLKENIFFLRTATSSSFMWTANSAVVSPSRDTQDKKVHITCANLLSNTHRSIETKTWQKLFLAVFNDPELFVHHHPVVHSNDFFDEGAANHTRFCTDVGSEGLHVFVYGRSQLARSHQKKYPARQTLEAQQVIAKTHGLKNVLHLQQNSKSIDEGVFHNDVIATGHQNFFLVHEKAYQDKNALLNLQKLDIVQILEKDLSVKEAVKCYLFNSQILTVGNKRIILAPVECKTIHFCNRLLSEIADTCIYLPLDQSMHNGGGPACLRLRVVLTEKEYKAIHQGVIFSEELYLRLKQVIQKYYPDSFSIIDLKQPEFLQNIRKCYEKIYHILKLSSILEY